MQREYKKIFEEDKKKLKYTFLPVKRVPEIVCPQCFSNKAGMCADCGTFMCTNVHAENPKSYDRFNYYYYDSRKGEVKQGHNPSCQKEIPAEEIAKRVVELLAANKNSQPPTPSQNILDELSKQKILFGDDMYWNKCCEEQERERGRKQNANLNSLPQGGGGCPVGIVADETNIPGAENWEFDMNSCTFKKKVQNETRNGKKKAYHSHSLKYGDETEQLLPEEESENAGKTS